MTAGEVAPHIIRVVGAYASAGELKVYAVNNGVISSTYTGLYMFGETAIPRALSLYDLQGAGKLDIVAAADGANEVQVFPGNGDGTFTWPPQVLLACHLWSHGLGGAGRQPGLPARHRHPGQLG